MKQNGKRYAKSKQQRAKGWIVNHSAVEGGILHGNVSSAKAGTFFVKREIDYERSDTRLFDAINHMHSELPDLESLQSLSVSIIGPRDGSRLQSIARRADKTLHLARIQEKVKTELSSELVVFLGGVACFGASKTRAGRRFIGFHIDSSRESIIAERESITNMYGAHMDLFPLRTHLSVATTSDQQIAELAMGALRGKSMPRMFAYLKPAELGYVSMQNKTVG